MAIKTYTQQLEEVQAAITAILTGAQSYNHDGRTLTRADLSTLEEREKRLRPLAERESKSSGKMSIQYVEYQ